MVSFNSSMNFNNEIEEVELDLPNFIGNGHVLVAESSGRTSIVSDDEYKKNKRERVSVYEDVLAVIENVLDNVEIKIADNEVKKIAHIEPRILDNDIVKVKQQLELNTNDDNIVFLKEESPSGESAIGNAVEGESLSIKRALDNDDDVVKFKRALNLDDENIFLKGESSNGESTIGNLYAEKETKSIQIEVDINNNDAVNFSKGESSQDELKIDLISKENVSESKEAINFPNQIEEQQLQEKTPSLKIFSESQELIISHLHEKEDKLPALNLNLEMEMKNLIVEEKEKVELKESSTMTSQPLLLSQETSMSQKLINETFTMTSQPMCLSQGTSMSQIFFNDNCTMTSQPMKLSQETWMSQTELIESFTNTSQPMLISQETCMSQPFVNDTCTMTSQSLITQEEEEKEKEKVNLEIKDCETNTSQSILIQDNFLEHNESPKNEEEIKHDDDDEPFVDETDSKEMSLQKENEDKYEQYINTPLVLSPEKKVDGTNEIDQDQNQKKMGRKRKHSAKAIDKKSKKRRSKKSRKSKRKRDPRNYDPEIIWTKSSGKEYAYEGDDEFQKPKKSKKKKSSSLVRLGLSKSKKPSKILHESFHLNPVKVYSSSSEESSEDDSDSSSSDSDSE